MSQQEWFQISKDDGSVTTATTERVLEVAHASYTHAADVVHAGRFQTTFAIYSQRRYLTEDETTAARVLVERQTGTAPLLRKGESV
jgi:hypothetical protein